jgi:hypothetical protein
MTNKLRFRHMRTIGALTCVGLLLLLAPASAQSGGPVVWPLKVSVHKSLQNQLSDRDVEQLLDEASARLQHQNCDVTFKLNGAITTFTGPPSVITNDRGRDAVYDVNDADVKLVQHIKFCRPNMIPQPPYFNGCSYPFSKGRKSSIVTHSDDATTTPLRGILWAHEFGHRTGLPHRGDADALMTSCQGLFGQQRLVTAHECSCFRRGPGGCPPPNDPNPVCSDNLRRR